MKNLAIRDVFGLTLRDLGKKIKKIAVSPDLKAATNSYFFKNF